MRPVIDLDLDALPRDERGHVTWTVLAAEHGADYLIDVAVAAVAQGEGKVARAARAAHVREIMRANGATGRRGRPMKGATRRDARLVCYIESRVRDLIAQARVEGESYADVITRWAEQHGGAA